MRYNSEDFIVEAVADIYEDYQIGEYDLILSNYAKIWDILFYPMTRFWKEQKEIKYICWKS